MRDIQQHIHRRTRCPLCLSPRLGRPIAPHVDLQFPLLPVCVETPQSEDVFAPFTICMCEQCGVITMLDVVDPAVLYDIFHSDGLGKVWEEHYERFAELIRRHHRGGRVVEAGAGQGKLIQRLRPHYGTGLEVIDPQYEGPRDGVVVHEQLCDSRLAATLKGQFDSFVSSHTLEHFVEFQEYFTTAWACLKEGGLLFTSVPNQEAGFAKGFGNMLNFEHPSICTNLHWIYLHYRYGFVLKEISTFRGHSMMFVAQRVEQPVPFELDARAVAADVLDQYTRNVMVRIRKVRDLATRDKENWLFGASNFSQPLFVYGLEDTVFSGVLDNSPLKHNKRLYGTSLMCRRPEDIVGPGKPLRVFLNVGAYNNEVEEQLRALADDSVECVAL